MWQVPHHPVDATPVLTRITLAPPHSHILSRSSTFKHLIYVLNQPGSPGEPAASALGDPNRIKVIYSTVYLYRGITVFMREHPFKYQVTSPKAMFSGIGVRVFPAQSGIAAASCAAGRYYYYMICTGFALSAQRPM